MVEKQNNYSDFTTKLHLTKTVQKLWHEISCKNRCAFSFLMQIFILPCPTPTFWACEWFMKECATEGLWILSAAAFNVSLLINTHTGTGPRCNAGSAPHHSSLAKHAQRRGAVLCPEASCTLCSNWEHYCLMPGDSLAVRKSCLLFILTWCHNPTLGLSYPGYTSKNLSCLHFCFHLPWLFLLATKPS